MKGVVSVLVALLTMGVCYANPMVGESVHFEASLNPMDCTEQACDLDVTDGHGIFMYGQWALKDPDGIVREKQEPELACSGLYTPSIDFVADKVGKWKFCAQTEAFWMDWYNDTCNGGYFGCDDYTMKCMEVFVGYDCDTQPLIDQLVPRFLAWLNKW